MKKMICALLVLMLVLTGCQAPAGETAPASETARLPKPRRPPFPLYRKAASIPIPSWVPWKGRHCPLKMPVRSA